MRIVIKFGGTSVATPRLLAQMAAKVKAMSAGNEVAVIVSAMGDTTRRMIELLKGVGRHDSDLWEVSDVIGMGEVLSARLMALALRKAGARALAVTPDSPEWPVFANVIGNEKVREEKVNQEPLAAVKLAVTTEMCTKHLLPLMSKRTIPVICGFLARDDNGRTVVLGRGGSDISAVAVGRCLSADRVVIVTDVPGVLRADPRLIPTRQSIKKISVSEVESLARGGARIVHPASLQYKLSQQQIVVVDYRSKSFLRGGTEIVGKRHAEIFRTAAALACITVVGRNFIGTPGLLNMLTERLARMKITIFGVSVSENYMGLYVNQRQADAAHEAIFRDIDRQPKFSALSVLKGIGRLRLSSTAFIEQPGIIGRIGDLLAMKGINIIEMITIQTDITIFLHRDDLNKAYALLKKFSF